MSLRAVRLLVISLLAALSLVTAPARADRMVGLEKATHDPSWKVRLQAAAILARSNEPRAVPILTRLLRDDQAVIRRFAAEALEKIATATAPTTTPETTTVKSTLRPGGVHIAIGGIGAKPKNVSPAMTQRLRMLLLREFSQTPGLTIDGTPVSGFLIDSSITALSRKTTRDWVEISCEISVIVGRLPSKAMVMMTSGGATVQESKTNFHDDREPIMEADALEGAVKGAHENLLSYLRKQR